MRKYSFVTLFCVFVAGICGIFPAKAALSDGLVAFWPFDEITTSNTVNDVYFTNHFSLAGATPPTIVPGQVGNAINLTGAGYLINSHDSNNIASGLPEVRNGVYTIAMWVKGTNQTARFIYTHGNTATATPIYIIQTGQQAGNNAKLDLIIRNDANATQLNHIQTTNAVFDGTWHHIAVVDNRGQVRIYVDGALDPANFNYTPAGVLSFNNTVLGGLVRTTTTPSFIGQVDELAVWERALSAAEVAAVRTNGIARPAPQEISITAGPTNVSKGIGDWVIFSVEHAGVRPISYQWYKNGVLIPDATNRTFQATGLVATNTGDYYQVAVSNLLGGVLSQRGTITVTNDPAVDVRRDLVSYWPLNVITNEGGIFSSPDLYSGNSMILQGFFDTTTVEGKFGQALDFDGLTKYAYRTNGSPIYATTNYSVSMWVKADFNFQGDRRLFSEGATNSNTPLFTIGVAPGATNGAASVLIRGDNNVSVVGARVSKREAFNNEWRHVVWTDANGAGKLYIDGVLDETDYNYTRTPLTLHTTSLGAIVRAAVGNYLLGQIDEVATWQRVLTYSEIQSIMTNGVPAPVGLIPPGIVTQPLTRTNGVFQGDTVTFTVAPSGTAPLRFEWYRGGVLISTNSNPSAGTASLVLTNVQPGDSGSTFYVRVINSAGNVQSDTVDLNVTPYTPLTTGEVLKVDFGLAGSPNVQSGFSEFTLAMNGTNYGGIGVTVVGIGASVEARLRGTPTNGVAMTQAQLYQDFVFANAATDNTGLRLILERLAPNTKYGVTIWSYDSGSTGLRQSFWTETSDPNAPVLLIFGYNFDGAVLPTQDEQNTIRATLTSTAAGKLQIDALRSGGTSVGAFLNAIRLEANPAPRIRSVQLLNGNTISIDVEVIELGQNVAVRQRDNVATGAWLPSNATQVNEVGLIKTFEIPINPQQPQRYYRIETQ